jgi:hypothetical protein
LTCTSNIAAGLTAIPSALVNEIGQGLFAVQPLLGEGLAECRFLGERLQIEQRASGLSSKSGAECIDQHRGQFGVGLKQPAAEGDAVGLVVDPLRVKLVQLGEHRAAHQLGMQPGHAVDAVRAEERQVAHAHTATIVFLDQRHRAQHVEIGIVLGSQASRCAGR